MKTVFTVSFERDLKRTQDKRVRAAVLEMISRMEAANRPAEIAGLKRLRAGDNCYRLRIGDYRIGLVITENVAKFVRLLHRSEIYRFFP